MGADTWLEWVPFKVNVQKSLEAAQKAALKRRGLASREEAYEAAEDMVEFADVLDVWGLVKRKRAGQCLELGEAAVKKLFGSAQPARAAIEANLEQVFDALERGEQRCVVAWKKGKPAEVLFLGLTVD